jgi:hypothetical protein
MDTRQKSDRSRPDKCKAKECQVESSKSKQKPTHDRMLQIGDLDHCNWYGERGHWEANCEIRKTVDQSKL